MFCVFLQADSGSEFAFQGMYIVWTPKGLGNNIARKCLECWNAAVGVDEGKNAFQPTSVRVLLMTGNEYMVGRRNFETWSST